MQRDNADMSLVVLAAGSLRSAFVGIIDTFERRVGLRVRAEHGPAGLLREKIEQGAAFDVFASANMAHPLRLHELGLAGPVVRFARNRLCLISRRELGMTAENMLDIMLDARVKLGTSTPEIDPSGDYAIQFFAMINALYPGKGDSLAAKSKALVGGRVPAAIPSGYSAAGWLIGQGLADVFVSYASNGRQSLADQNLRVVDLPDKVGPIADYGVTLNPNAQGAARLFQDHLLTPLSQQELERHGFLIQT